MALVTGPAAYPVPALGLSPKAWTGGGAAFTITDARTGVVFEVVATATSTVVLHSEQNGVWGPADTWLRMYGLYEGLNAHANDGSGLQRGLGSQGNVTLPNLPQPYPGSANKAWFDSNKVPFGGALASASAYTFNATLNTTGTGGVAPGVLTCTAIPGTVGPRTLEGRVLMYSAYNDTHVLKLKERNPGMVAAGVRNADGISGGWLMVTARSDRKAVPVGHGFSADTGPNSVRTCIVGFWSPDPGFATEVVGPIFLAGRWHDLTLGGQPYRIPLWLGVPAVVEVEVDGEDWLYVYYTAEDTPIDRELPKRTVRPEELNPWAGVEDLSAFPDWQPGTFVRRIRTADLPWGRADGALVTQGGTAVVDPVAYTDEGNWDSEREIMLARGESLGKVRLWAAQYPLAGGGWARGSAWSLGDDPGAFGNVLVWDLKKFTKDTDAVPVMHDETFSIYVSINNWDSDQNAAPHETGQYAWGIWRFVAGPATAGRVYGTDFAACWIAEADDGRYRDNVARSNESLASNSPPWKGTPDPEIRVDPDPVRLPSGEWMVCAGMVGADSNGTIAYPLARFETSESNGDRPFRRAWK